MGLKDLSLTTRLRLDHHTDLWRSQQTRLVLSPSINGLVLPVSFCVGTWRAVWPLG